MGGQRLWCSITTNCIENMKRTTTSFYTSFWTTATNSSSRSGQPQPSQQAPSTAPEQWQHQPVYTPSTQPSSAVFPTGRSPPQTHSARHQHQPNTPPKPIYPIGQTGPSAHGTTQSQSIPRVNPASSAAQALIIGLLRPTRSHGSPCSADA